MLVRSTPSKEHFPKRRQKAGGPFIHCQPSYRYDTWLIMFSSTVWSQFLRKPACFLSLQKSLKIANEWHGHYYEDALDLDLINMQTLVSATIYNKWFSTYDTTELGRPYITIPCLRIRTPDKAFPLHDSLDRWGPVWSPSWLCRWMWLCCSLNEQYQWQGMAARVRETLSHW